MKQLGKQIDKLIRLVRLINLKYVKRQLQDVWNSQSETVKQCGAIFYEDFFFQI